VDIFKHFGSDGRGLGAAGDCLSGSFFAKSLLPYLLPINNIPSCFCQYSEKMESYRSYKLVARCDSQRTPSASYSSATSILFGS
jgi:hypothetical protein